MVRLVLLVGDAARLRRLQSAQAFRLWLSALLLSLVAVACVLVSRAARSIWGPRSRDPWYKLLILVEL